LRDAENSFLSTIGSATDFIFFGAVDFSSHTAIMSLHRRAQPPSKERCDTQLVFDGHTVGVVQ
jgi:hypothetical protein